MIKKGKPHTSKSSINNFINTLDYMISNNVGQKLGTKHTGYPIITFKNDLKKYYNLYSVNSYSELLTRLKECVSCWNCWLSYLPVGMHYVDMWIEKDRIVSFYLSLVLDV